MQRHERRRAMIMRQRKPRIERDHPVEEAERFLAASELQQGKPDIVGDLVIGRRERKRPQAGLMPSS